MSRSLVSEWLEYILNVFDETTGTAACGFAVIVKAAIGGKMIAAMAIRFSKGCGNQFIQFITVYTYRSESRSVLA